MNSRAERYWAADGSGKLGFSTGEPPGDPHRGAAVASLGYGPDPRLAQRLQQLPQGPLAEALGAGQEILSLS